MNNINIHPYKDDSPDWAFTPKFGDELDNPRPVMDSRYTHIKGEHGVSKVSGKQMYIWYNRPIIKPAK